MDKKIKEYTDIQRKLFKFICDYVADNGYSPLFAEMAAHMGCHKATIQFHIKRLIAHGLITKEPDNARAIKIVRNDG